MWFFLLPYYILFDRDDSGSGIGAAFVTYFAYIAAMISLMIQAAILLIIVVLGIILL